MNKKLFDYYKDYVLTHHEKPSSVYAFCKENKLKESDFYKHYNSFDALENSVTNSFLKHIIETLHKDDNFTNYNSREKMLALFYAWTEKALEERSFFVYLAKNDSGPTKNGIGALKLQFNEFVKHIIRDAINANEILERKFISDKYFHAVWTQFILIHTYWLKDKSHGFEKTDAFIEKSTRLLFDLLGQTALDSALDLAKLMFQKK